MSKKWLWISVAIPLLLSACAQIATTPADLQEPPVTREAQIPASGDSPAEESSQAASPESTQPPTEELAEPTPRSSTPNEFSDEPPPPGAEAQFSTDFSRHSISYTEILSGGPPKDGIPAIDRPEFVSVADADEWLSPKEPVILFHLGEDARAYPLQILTWHEIVNDVVNDIPVVVTFCPLCNTAIAFERTHNDMVLDFGTTGRLRFSNLIMYDRQTETWWQQATGDAIAGEFTGDQLTFLPATILAWEDFKANHPQGRVLSRNTGFPRNYGRNPYAGYDDIRNSPFLYQGPDNSGRLPPMARVLTLELGEEAIAYPYDLLSEQQVINDLVAEESVVIFWQSGTASALDNQVLAEGRDVGSASSFSRELDGQILTFQPDGENFTDEETQSTWNVLGQAVAGPLSGTFLEPVVSVNHFWFSWAAFKPETRIFEGS